MASTPTLHRIPAVPLADAARTDATALLARLESTAVGLTAEEAEARLVRHGTNEIARERVHGWLERFVSAARNPLVVLLTVLAILSFATGDARAGTVMLIMVVLGVTLRLVQETRADEAAARLKAMITVTATALRDGREVEVPLAEIVPGDVIRLAAGDLVPADVRLLTAKDLFVTQASLTGESLPVEKSEAPDTREGLGPLEYRNLCFLGTNVESGSAAALVVTTGGDTSFGAVARSVSAASEETSFDRGVKRFTWLMIRFMAVMVPLVFLVNGLMKHDWHEAFFFSMAVAVGLTPEMLPMIVSVCLSNGAVSMSKHKVIVKRLNSIQNFGAMDVLCTDKTGTLTADHIILELHCDLFKKDSEEVLRDAYLISHFQTGLRNVLDRAVLAHRDEVHDQLSVDRFRKIDEIPFDFSRRMMSVVVEAPDGARQFLTKGAPEAVFACCSRFESEGEIFDLEPLLATTLMEEVNELCEDGFRVLAIAQRPIDARPEYAKSDESNLILTGYLAFLDPPKDTARQAIDALRQHGVAIKVLTGDNDLVTRKVCREVGIDAERILLGRDVENMDDERLTEALRETDVCARLSPVDKQRIVKALRRQGHVVGYMGDGINDAPALRAADVGISVDNAVDIAKESADLILLEKSLMVLEEGVLEGRKVFANILKYVRMGASSNFGNMFSVIGASAWLPYMPMAPIQVLTNNLLYDFSQVPIPTDNVGEDQTARPRPWHMGEIAKFIIYLGPVSSIFDYVTFGIMWWIFRCNQLALAAPPALASRFAHATDPDQTYAAALFHTGWFVESLMTQTLVIHVIRTARVPFVQSRASLPLTVTTVLVMMVGAWLPVSPFAAALGFVPLPNLYWPLLGATLLGYLALTQAVKGWLVRRKWM